MTWLGRHEEVMQFNYTKFVYIGSTGISVNP